MTIDGPDEINNRARVLVQICDAPSGSGRAIGLPELASHALLV